MGVPTLGCDCSVCTSADPRDRRLRPSVLLRWSEPNIESPQGVVAEERVVLIDTGPDFREQALRNRLRRVDAVLYTHSHADHILGLDDLRPLSFIAYRAGRQIPLYAAAETAAAEIDLQASVDAARDALHLSTERYESGYSAYLDVLDAEGIVAVPRSAGGAAEGMVNA